eukprot:g6534.t2
MIHQSSERPVRVGGRAAGRFHSLPHQAEKAPLMATQAPSGCRPMPGGPFAGRQGVHNRSNAQSFLRTKTDAAATSYAYLGPQANGPPLPAIHPFVTPNAVDNFILERHLRALSHLRLPQRRPDGPPRVRALRGATGPAEWTGPRVLELGCGHGVPGLVCGLAWRATVDFHDWSEETLQEVTARNCALNGLEGSSVRFLSGDWSSLLPKEESYQELLEILASQSCQCRAYFAGKRFYFGCDPPDLHGPSRARAQEAEVLKAEGHCGAVRCRETPELCAESSASRKFRALPLETGAAYCPKPCLVTARRCCICRRHQKQPTGGCTKDSAAQRPAT